MLVPFLTLRVKLFSNVKMIRHKWNWLVSFKRSIKLRVKPTLNDIVAVARSDLVGSTLEDSKDKIFTRPKQNVQIR